MAILSLAHPRAAGMMEAPFAFDRGMIWVAVSVGGQPEPLEFLLDSGASATVISLSAAERMGLPLGKPEMAQGVQGMCCAYRVAHVSANIRGVSAPESMLAIDMNRLNGALHRRVDGLIGADFFQQHVVQIDYRERKLRVYARDETVPTQSAPIAMAMRNGAFCVKARVDGNQPAWFRVDTGCSSALEWCPGRSETHSSAHSSIASAAISRYSARAELLLGCNRFHNVATGLHDHAMFPGESGLLGNGLLSPGCVTIDAAGRRLYLAERN